MKTVNIIYKRNGENVGTIAPHCPMNDSINLDEEAAYCYNWDDNRLVTAKVYEVLPVDMPDWMTPEDYCANWIEYKYCFGLDASMEWSEQWIKGLLKLSGARRYAAIKLLNTKKFRSPVRQNMRYGLEEWLNGADIKINDIINVTEYDYREYRLIANHLYYSSR